MSSAYSDADLQLFVDLDRAAVTIGTAPCLIGAGAIRLGASLGWQVRLERATVDWDFAVRMDSWAQFRALSEQLVGQRAGFERTAEPHRFRHRAGGTLDLLPYGPLEEPAGSITWESGLVMDAAGLNALEEHHESAGIPSSALRIASLPALVGLKLLAYRARRPGTTRDIGDVAAILRAAEREVSDERIDAQAGDRLHSGEVRFSEIGSYLLGRDIGRVFTALVLAQLSALLDEACREDRRIVHDALRAGATGESEAELARRLQALRIGLLES